METIESNVQVQESNCSETSLTTTNQSQESSGSTPLLNNQEKKICKKCGEEFPIERFALKKRFNGQGVSYYREGSCKKCVGLRKKQYIENLSPEKKEEYNRKRREASQRRLAKLTDEEKQAIKERNKKYKENLH